MQDTIPVSIDINETIQSFCVVQHDNGTRKVMITIFDMDNPDERKVELTDHCVRLYCLLPDGETKTFIDGEVVDEANGVVQFVLTDDVTQQEGAVQASVLLRDGENVISLRRFTFGVMPSFVTADDISSWIEEDEE